MDYLLHWLVLFVPLLASVMYFRRHRKSPSRLQLIVGNGLVVIALLGAVIVIGETYLRFFYDTTMWHGGALTSRKWFAQHEQLNSFDWRDREFRIEKAPGVERIVFIGDSFTWGYGVPNLDDRFPDRVRAELERRAPGRYEVWNIGKIGAHTADETLILTQMLRRCPVDRVVLAYAPNDVQDLLPRGIGDLAPWSDARPGSLRAHSFLLDHLVIRTSITDTTLAEQYFAELDLFHRDPARFAAQVERMRALQRICRDANVGLDVVVFPLISHWGPDYPFAAWHDRIEESWSSLGVPVVDLREAWAGQTREQLRVNSLDDHPNEHAHELVANLLLERIF